MPEQFVFRDLRDLLAKANEEKSGDQLAGLAARSERERVAAKRKLADLTLGEIVRQPLIDPSQDEVSRLLLESYDAERFQRIQTMTVGEFREFILDDATCEERLKELQWAIIPEIAAAVAKIMSNKDLILAAAKIRNVTRCRNTMGERGVLGFAPAQSSCGRYWRDFAGCLRGAPLRMRRRRDWSKPGDGFGGDGWRDPARARPTDRRLSVPTQSCCLAHITTQLEAMSTARRWIYSFSLLRGPNLPTSALECLCKCCAKGANKFSNTTRNAMLPGRAPT